jgi:AraC-like DNA-binding protein
MLELSPSLPVQAHNGGLFISRGQGAHPERVIGSWELIFVREGMLMVEEEKERFEVGAGESLLLWPGRRHRGAGEYTPDLAFYWIHFGVRDGGGGFSGPPITVPQHTTVARPNHLTELFRRFLDDQEAGRSHPMSASLLLMLMLCEVSCSQPVQEVAKGNATVLAQRAEAHIRTHFHTPMGTSALASELGCNPDYLGRVFRRVYGLTLTEFKHRRRVHHARRMLIESDRNVEEISRACGFKDVGYFRRLFKRHEGMTPLAFRRLYAQMHVNTQ